MAPLFSLEIITIIGSLIPRLQFSSELDGDLGMRLHHALVGNLAFHRLKRRSPSRLSVMSSDSSSFNYYSEDLLERLFPSNVSTSGGSDDTGSIHSSASAGTEQGRLTRPASVPTVRKHLGQKEPDVASISEPSTHMRQYSGDGSSPSNQHDTISENGGSLQEPKRHSNLFSSQKAKKRIPSSQADVLSQVSTSVVVEDAEAKSLGGDESMDAYSPTSPLSMSLPSSMFHTERETSPGLLECPTSPVEGFSPTSSPRLRHKKTRMATRKRTHKSNEDFDFDVMR